MGMHWVQSADAEHTASNLSGINYHAPPSDNEQSSRYSGSSGYSGQSWQYTKRGHDAIYSRFVPDKVKATPSITRCHAIAKTTARCAQYMSALKIVFKHKSSRRLRKNLHITILSLFGSEIIFEVFQQMWSRYLNVTGGQTDGQFILWHHRSVKIGKHNIADIIGIADILT